MKLYIFENGEGQIIEQVRAENHDEALVKATKTEIEFMTDFYSVSAA